LLATQNKNNMSDPIEEITQRIKEGFITALEKKPYSKLKVTDIVENANTSRNTFYRYYKSKDQVMYEILDEHLDEYFSEIDSLNEPLTEERVTLIFKAAYLHVLQHKQLTKLMFSSGMDDLIYKKVRSFSKRICGNICRTRDIKISDPEYFEYMVALYSGGVFQLFKHWVLEGMSADVDRIAKLNTLVLNEHFIDLIDTPPT